MTRWERRETYWFVRAAARSFRRGVRQLLALFRASAAGETLTQQYLKDPGYRTASIGKLHYWPPTAAHARTHDGMGPCGDS